MEANGQHIIHLFWRLILWLYSCEVSELNERQELPPLSFEALLSYPFGGPVGEKEVGENLIGSENQDELYDRALELIKSEGKASTSFLQRKLQIGYNRAARIIDMMEANGEVSKANHVGKRELLKWKK